MPINAAFQEGSFIEFAANTETTTFAQPSTTTNANDFGIFRITLGAPITSGDITLYPITVTGDAIVGGKNFTPRWAHIGTRNGSIVGVPRASVPSGGRLRPQAAGGFSVEGGTPQPAPQPVTQQPSIDVQTIYSASGTSASNLTARAAGFFIAFGTTENVVVSNQTFTGDYNTLAGVRVAHSSASGGCETLLGLTLCQEESTTFSESEFYKDGIGPIGYQQDVTYSSNSGSFFTSTTIRQRVEVIRTSLSSADASVIRPAPWRELAAMTTPRKNVTASAHNGEIYVFGGLTSSNANLDSVEIYNPENNTWRSGVSAPVPLGFYKAATVGNRTFLINAGANVLVFDHVSNAWSTGVGGVAPFADPSFDIDVWIDSANGRTFIVVYSSKLSPGLINVHAYEVQQSPNSWFTGTFPLETTDHRWFAMRVLGNAAYLAGGFRQFLDESAFGGTLRQDQITGTWNTSAGTLQVRRLLARAVTLNGTMHLLGGRDGAGRNLRDMESYNVATSTWTAQAKMLRPRVDHAAVALGDSIYVIGGRSDDSSTALANVDVFTSPSLGSGCRPCPPGRVCAAVCIPP
jgi:hypothetical protein